MTNTDVLPCPFCGHVGLDFSEGSTFRWMLADCGKCGATAGETRVKTMGEGTHAQQWEEAKLVAIKQWNTRHQAATQAAQAVPGWQWVPVMTIGIDESEKCRSLPFGMKLYAAPPGGSVSLAEVEQLAQTMWRGEVLPGRVLRFGAAVLGLIEAAGQGGVET